MSKLSDNWRTPDELYNQLNDEFNFDIDLCATFENSKCDTFFTDYLTDEFYIYGAANGCYPGDYRDLIKDTTCFMNPPYSNPKPFIEKAWEDSRHCKIVLLVKVDPSTKWWSTFWDYDVHCNWCDRFDFARYPNQKFVTEATTIICPYCKDTLKYSGPKPGCSQPRYFNKRIQFDPPIELVTDGYAWQIGRQWYQICADCCGQSVGMSKQDYFCSKCKNVGHYKLSGPSFASCILIFDRRGL